eukprot:TRINITY_DN3168_c0_g1_i6.p1 TRINITY_DN3168_c0_g1~~TRINITY_DN3168_c0_g1_i6.p1  ORF type:complete len:101 (+),score=13.68 TRINITY_DN3168_c0_g1_i6:318-620(+)
MHLQVGTSNLSNVCFPESAIGQANNTSSKFSRGGDFFGSIGKSVGNSLLRIKSSPLLVMLRVAILTGNEFVIDEAVIVILSTPFVVNRIVFVTESINSLG